MSISETAPGVTAEELYASHPHVMDSPEWVKQLPAAREKTTEQLFVVAGLGMDKTTASVSLHERDEDGNWKQILSTPAYVGRNGMCLDKDHLEGIAQTPIGVYRFTKAFGISDDPGSRMPYFKVTENTYWSADEREGMRYNEMVDGRDYPDLDMTNTEHIVDYEFEYRYCLNIGFNEEGTPGRGSAIFLHCIGARRPYTGGCVAVPEYMMKLILRNVRAECVVVIDTLEAMNGTI